MYTAVIYSIKMPETKANSNACREQPKIINLLLNPPGIRAMRAWGKKPLLCGPRGARVMINRGTVSSAFNFKRDIKRSGRSLIFSTLQADDLPLRYNNINSRKRFMVHQRLFSKKKQK